MEKNVPYLLFWLLSVLIFSCSSGTEKSRDPENGVDSTVQRNDPGIKSNGEIQNRIEGNYLFSIKPIISGKSDSIIGYLHLDQGKYTYTGQNKSPFLYAFVHQERGSYTLQFLGQATNSTGGNLSGEIKKVAKIRFEIIGGEKEQVVKEFYLIMDEKERKVKFGSMLEGFQLWRIEKPYADSAN